MAENNEWWRGAVIYQIYPRSFCDSNGDGVGDLLGMVSKLDYLADLGVDGVWVSPFFKSPMKDFGYDVSDYSDVDPVFGTLDDFKRFLDGAHDRDIKVIIDQVYSHTSDEHVWFKKSRSDRTNVKSDWYVWADPKPDGTVPNNWLSYFGGPAWTFDPRRHQYYLHHFGSFQPSLNIWNPEVRDRIKKTAGFWLDMGVDGFRLDVAHTYLYDPELKDNPVQDTSNFWPSDLPHGNPLGMQQRVNSMCRPENYDWIREFRSFIDQWDNKCLMAEAGGDHAEEVATSYSQGGDLFHMSYTYGICNSDMSHNAVSSSVKLTNELIKDGYICWATSNHDVTRVISRVNTFSGKPRDIAFYCMALGMSLRGSFCMYQGEELGLPQAELRFEDLQDPYDIHMYPDHLGRDGGRTPLPWYHNMPHAGFTTGLSTWLPVAEAHLPLSADLQDTDKDSILNAYRHFLKWRKETPAIRKGDIDIHNTEEPFFVFTRSHGDKKVMCIFNCSDTCSVYRFTEDEANIKLSPVEHVSHGVIDFEKDKIKFNPYGYAFFEVE